MDRVTAIRPKGRTKNRWVVELDDRAFATVGPDELTRFSIHSGETLDPATKVAIAEASLALSAYDRAVRMLAAGGRAKGDLKRRLVEKGEKGDHAAAAVERLAAQGLLDDGAYARQYVRSRAGAHGRQRLAFDLSRRGVSRELAKAAVDEVLADPSIDARASLDRLAEKRLRSLASLDEPTRRRRVTAFLARRGFGAGEIRDALARLGRAR